eukprot:CAMPEP_0176079996 /NCGR_PEP_ID=MMETSP0120_2-20121206/40012_1 /TAXON_ID=160619 /ORGANISM="Kryptoperidinium foliaceum, Strain CCMP 1326" /LENGTH=290 /DNA_ID=CAMNT_0017413757 /DNA_START=37 /DNA_END=906 /DNA_ORIENTATION=-
MASTLGFRSVPGFRGESDPSRAPTQAGSPLLGMSEEEAHEEHLLEGSEREGRGEEARALRAVRAEPRHGAPDARMDLPTRVMTKQVSSRKFGPKLGVVSSGGHAGNVGFKSLTSKPTVQQCVFCALVALLLLGLFALFAWGQGRISWNLRQTKGPAVKIPVMMSGISADRLSDKGLQERIREIIVISIHEVCPRTNGCDIAVDFAKDAKTADVEVGVPEGENGHKLQSELTPERLQSAMLPVLMGNVDVQRASSDSIGVSVGEGTIVRPLTISDPQPPPPPPTHVAAPTP